MRLYSGINLYLSKAACQSAWDRGGIVPDIDELDRVEIGSVAPPTGFRPYDLPAADLVLDQRESPGAERARLELALVVRMQNGELIVKHVLGNRDPRHLTVEHDREIVLFLNCAGIP